MSIINIIPSKTIRRNLKDSGTFTIRNNSTISSLSSFDFTLDQRFNGYDEVTIINLNSNNDCTVFINGTNIQQPLPKGNSINVNHTTVKTIRIKNNGASEISENEIEIYYRHTGQREINQSTNAASIVSAVGSVFNLFRRL